ncbi:sigma-70 family RNA polymerase sigma factor [Neobittarella massiliensis]|uniref:Sigma-70 family RNA polymerase sigma factor n=1 Tax=Neobittarella massiliensis (ex Bilen et al. 2018) TaxID=2041842 RepID=A0A8J6M041_9FIRM|nr:sigma-70 family RNA polymerase sigma factor [Neobittarella massiliensis]MBC3517353.1 sigma-70 family RNA polymerase sigma factor [Neobittarella massiliensis]
MQLTHQQLGELLVRARRGDRAAFDALYAATAPMQAGQIRRYLGDDKATDDILQGVYLVLWQNIGRLSQPRGLVAYLNRITYNLCMNYRRRQARETERVQGAGELEDIADRRDPVAAYDDREAVRTALGWLSENELEAVTLRYFEQLKIAQVADRMHLSERTVKRLLRAALDKMRQGLHFVFLPLPLPLLHWGAARPAGDKGRAARRLLPAGIAAILCCFGAAATLRPIDIQATVQDSQPARQKTVQIQPRGLTGNNRVQMYGPSGKAVALTERRRGAVYTATVTEEGEYTVRARSPGGTQSQTAVYVQGVDRRGPQLLHFMQDGSTLTLQLADDSDLQAVTCVGSDGGIYPGKLDRAAKRAVFSIPPGDYTVQATDVLGNGSTGTVHMDLA